MHAEVLTRERLFIEGFQLLPAIKLEIVITPNKRSGCIVGKDGFQTVEIAGIEKSKIARLQLLNEFN